MNKINFLIFLVLFSSCATRTQLTGNATMPAAQFSFDGHKKYKASKTIFLDYKYFQIAYDQERRLAKYVVYRLTSEQLSKKSAERKNKFKADPQLIERNIPYVHPSEYNHSGFDRGHLAPSADFSWSQEANDLTFVMSNMAPQLPNLNRDSWRRLEDKIRKWACGEGIISVITGPILKDGLPKLAGGLEIPQDFFKIVIDETPPVKMISFVYHQNDKGDVLAQRIVPLKSIEESSGIAINSEFPQLKNESMRMPASLNQWKEDNCD